MFINGLPLAVGMKREILLVQPKAGNWENLGIRAPDGLLTVAALPYQKGHNIKILDLRLEKDWKAKLKEHLDKNPILVATTCMTGIQIKYALEVSEFVKKMHPEVPVVWGGVHATFMWQQTLENPNVDIVVIDEGDLTLCELIEKLESKQPLDDVLGIAYKKDGEITKNSPRPLIKNLDDLPFPPYELVDREKYYGMTVDDGERSMTLMTSRGCPFKCTFCYDTKMYGNSWRAMSIDRTIELIKHVVEKFGVKSIFFQDDNFATDPKRFRGIVQKLIELQLGIKWGLLGVRIDALEKFDDDFFRDLRKAGCVNFDSGIESGSDQILRLIKKQITREQIIRVNKRLAQFGFLQKYTFIVGYPSETIEDLKASVDLATTLVKDNPGAYTPFFIYTAYPGVELWEVAKQYGVEEPKKLEDWQKFDYENAYLHYKWLDEKRISMIKSLAFTSNFANRNIKYKISKKYLRVLFELYRPLALMRFRYNMYQFPVDIKLGQSLANAMY